MQIPARNITLIKRFLVLVVLMFGLMPCTVKEAVLDSVGIEFNRSFNLSRTTIQNNQCQSLSATEASAYSVSYANEVEVLPVATSEKLEALVVIETANGVCKTASGNSPPYYILYKKLKLDMA